MVIYKDRFKYSQADALSISLLKQVPNIPIHNQSTPIFLYQHYYTSQCALDFNIQYS